jgi:hypothetical protein
MSIRIKNSQLNSETIEALNKLIDLDINASVAFKLTRIIKEVSSIVDDKVKMERRILDKFSEKDENGTIIQAKDEQGNFIPGSVNIINMNDFSIEMTDLMEIENEVPYDKINFDDLNLQTAKVKDLIKLEFLFN